jgi:putative transposase
VKIASSTYYVALTRLKSVREIRDEELKRLMQRAYDGNYKVYGARKVWWELHREGIGVGRCRVERLMRNMGIVRNNGSGRRGSRGQTARITVSDKDGSWAPELVKRQRHGGRAEPVAGGGFHLCFHLGGNRVYRFRD